MTTTKTGRIKNVLPDRGFGFVTDDSGQDFFFHRDDVESASMFDAFRVGDEVEFVPYDPAPSKGPRAADVRYPYRDEVVAAEPAGIDAEVA